MNKILIVVDMQNDFITGSLGTAEAREIVPEVAEKINKFSGRIILTKDTHKEDYLSTQEGRSLPVEHCIEGTRGHDICDDLKAIESVGKAAVYGKGTFGSFEQSVFAGGKDGSRLLLLCRGHAGKAGSGLGGNEKLPD